MAIDFSLNLFGALEVLVTLFVSGGTVFEDFLASLVSLLLPQ